MDIDTRCPVCWRLDEDGGHCFLKCKLVKRLWRHMNLENIHMQLLARGNVGEVVNCILAMKESTRLSVIGLLWGWWNARNKCNAGEQLKTVEAISCSVHEVISEYAGNHH